MGKKKRKVYVVAAPESKSEEEFKRVFLDIMKKRMEEKYGKMK